MLPLKKILIVEDEAITAEYLCDVLEQLGYQDVALAGRGSEALQLLQQRSFDLVLLDVLLQGELDGIDLAHRLRSEYQVPFVFITSLSNKTTVDRIKDTCPHGYLMKPFTEQDIYVALEMAFARQASEQAVVRLAAGPGTPPAAFYVRDRGRHIKLEVDDLLWLEASGNYTMLHLRTGTIMVNSPLRQVEEQLPEANFARIHRSYVVAVRSIAAVDAHGITVTSGKVLPIGRVYRANVFQHLRLLE